MKKPSCYPDYCHTCESAECMVEIVCPVCGESHYLNIYDMDEHWREYCQCGAELFESSTTGTIWAISEDGEEVQGKTVRTLAEESRISRAREMARREESSRAFNDMMTDGMSPGGKMIFDFLTSEMKRVAGVL